MLGSGDFDHRIFPAFKEGWTVDTTVGTGENRPVTDTAFGIFLKNNLLILKKKTVSLCIFFF
jgi:hypothetical protein